MKPRPLSFRVNNDCWEVTSHVPNRGGYVRIKRDGPSKIMAHRYVWTLFHGAIPKGLFVLHHCDNPKCVNPAHLFIGTAHDNAVDMWSKGRGVKTTLSCENHPSAKLTNQTVTAMRSDRKNGMKYKEISEKYDISIGTLSPILCGYKWANL